MSKKHKNIPKKVTEKSTPSSSVKSLSTEVPMLFGLKTPMMIVLLLAITFITYIPALSNGFVLWDDPEYVLQSPYIQKIDLNTLFSVYYMGNYHPLALLSLAIDYSLFEFNPFGYHFMNLAFHLVNTLLVFVFVQLLTRKTSPFVSFFTALMFGIHPMHVESVAWVSERKDVLYTLFFLSSLVIYLQYTIKGGIHRYGLAIVLFLLSLLSKGQAVVLAPVLLVIDYFFGNGITKKTVLEKIPFFALSLTFGIIAIKAQGEEAAINENYYSKATSIFWGSYGYLVYLFKSVLPLKLSGAYPYPINMEDRSMPSYFYIMPVIAIAVLATLLVKFKTNKYVWFGLLFFSITISIVLKFIPVGDTIIAERYTYIPYIGLFIMIGKGLENLLANAKTKNIAIGIFLFAFLGSSAASFARIGVWKDSFTFWGDVTEKYPNYWRAYNCLGQEYLKAQNYEKAAEYFTLSGARDKWAPPVPYMMRGAIYTDHLKDYDKAAEDFKKVISFPNPNDPTQLDARHNLGLVYLRKGAYQEAIAILNEAMQMNPNHPKGYYLRGLVYAALNENDKAIADYTQAIKINPNYLEPYVNRGVIYTDKTNQLDLGLADFAKVLQLNPEHSDAFINTGICYYKKGLFDQAIAQFNTAEQRFQGVAKIPYLRGLCYAGKGDYANAYKDGMKAKNMGIGISDAQLMEWKNKAQ